MSVLTIADLQKAKLQGKAEVQGVPIAIENRTGSVRRWTDEEGNAGKTKMLNPYGYVEKTIGADGEEMDCYIGPVDSSDRVFVVNQLAKPSYTKFDEHKCFLGFGSAQEAKNAYLAHRNDPQAFGSISEMSVEEFKAWLAGGDTKLPTKTQAHSGLVEMTGKFERGTAKPGHKYIRREHGRIPGTWRYIYSERKPRFRVRPEAPEKKKALPKAPDLLALQEKVARRGKGEGREVGLTKQELRILLRNGKFALISAGRNPRLESEMSEAEQKARHGKLRDRLVEDGFAFSRVEGHYEGREDSFLVMVHDAERDYVKQIGKEFNQDSVIYAEGGKQELHYTTGEHTGKRIEGKGFEEKPEAADFYTRIVHPDGAHTKFALSFDWERMIEKAQSFFLGPRGGKWADPQRKISWKKPGEARERPAPDDPDGIRKLKERLATRSKPTPMSAEEKAKHLQVIEQVRQMVAKESLSAEKGHEATHAIQGARDAIENDDAKEAIRHLSTVVALLKAWHDESLEKAAKPPGGGWGPIPKGKKGGYRRRSKKGWEYWYPEAVSPKPTRPEAARAAAAPGPETKWTEEQYAAGDFDKVPAHWAWFQVVPGHPPIGWESGGVRIHSKHPVKEAGHVERLYQIVGRPERGWARLRDVNSGEEMSVQEDRVFPVFHRPPVPKAKEVTWDPTTPTAKPPKVTGVAEKAVRVPAFAESTAKKGTALHKIENSYFVMKVIRQRHSDGELVMTRRLQVDDASKQQLLAEFAGMIQNVAKKAKRLFGLQDNWETWEGKYKRPAVNLTMVELRSAAMEGMLKAIDSYPGGMSFAKHAQFISRDYARLHAARERSGGLGMSKRHSRMLGGFIAARATAMRKLGVEDPTPEQIARFWILRKKDVHAGLEGKPQGNEGVPQKSYRLKAKREHEKLIDTDVQPGKIEWAERYDRFLKGTKEPGDLTEQTETLFPGLGIGLGLSPEDKVVIHNQMAKVLDALKEHTITLGEGRKKTTYKADSGEILRLSLGLDSDESMSIADIAQMVPVFRRTAEGEWKRLAERQAREVAKTFLERALDRARWTLDDKGAKVIEQAEDRLLPPEMAKPGPTYGEILKKRADAVPAERVAGWRTEEKQRLAAIADRIQERADTMEDSLDRTHQLDLVRMTRAAADRVDRIDEAEVRMRIARQLAPETAEMRRLATQTVAVEVEGHGFEYGWAVTTMTDPATGVSRRVRIRTFKDLRDPWTRENMLPGGHWYKSDANAGTLLTTGMIREVAQWPELMRLLYGTSDELADSGTIHRRIVETMLGVL